MIAIIYPKDDWDAIELAFKVQAIASSKGYKVYSPPKNSRRDNVEVFLQLNKVQYGIFLAYSSKKIDKDTLEELKHLMKNKKPVYSIIPEKLTSKIKDVGFKENVYSFKTDDYKAAIESINKAIDDIQIQTKKATAPLIGALILFGIILLLLLLFLGESD